MSAIVGSWSLDGRAVDPTDIRRMLASVAHRGPDGTAVWNGGPVALGHGMMWTTPESLQEKLPLANQPGDLVITADARLDNRDELIALTGFCDHLSHQITDSQLILTAYEKWGERCPERLIGDFAFAIWDARTQVLFCARDHFGVKPLYYYYGANQVFALASEIKALLCLPELPRRLNELRVADYLVSALDDQSMTFYRDIARLPPAHRMSVSRRGVTLQSYWSLDPHRELRLGSNEEYAGAFRELFTTAVSCRLRSAFDLGSHLSGGLDSSAVTCVARDLLAKQGAALLHTFSNIFDEVPQCDERPFINAVLDQGGLIPHYVHADRSGPLVDLERVLWHQDEPCIGPNHFLPWALNGAAHQAGVRIVLDGFDGDTTVSHGAVYFTELARKREWGTFAAEAEAVSKHFAVTPSEILHYYGAVYLDELATNWRWLAFLIEVQRIHQHFDVSRRDLVLHHGLQGMLPKCMRPLWHGQGGSIRAAYKADQIVDPSFARRIILHKRLRALHEGRFRPPLTVREDQWRTLTSGLLTLVLELADRCAAAFSIEARHSFLDKRLVEFCLAIPPEQKLHQGWGRLIMRRALTGILPEPVQWRGGKTDMSDNFIRGLLKFDRSLVHEAIFHKSEAIDSYVNIGALRELYHRLTSQPRGRIDDVMTLWRVVTLAQWLLYTGLKP